MEQVLRGKETAQIISQDDPVLFFPVRHHSPACSFHLERAMELYQPDCVLIEGPQNANALISTLTHADTVAPVAFYYYFKDSKGLLSEEKEDYKCYYPFLDYSPELVALREADLRGIPARFIDLPYGEILVGTAENRGVRKNDERQTYNDDYLLSRSEYLNRLCERTGLRNFDEFWEKYFEINGLDMGTEEFIGQMGFYCGLARENTPQEEMEADGCLLRERYMAQQIAKAAKTYKKILVVTGGFHTSGLKELLISIPGQEPYKDKKNENGENDQIKYIGQPVKLHNFAESDQGVYPLAYSMEAADALNGYASGMPSPGFYELVWKNINKEIVTLDLGQDDEDDEIPQSIFSTGTGGPYSSAVLHQLVTAGRQARRKKENISSYDVICALSMAQGLAVLRGKREPGLYELQDAALSSFVKGECNPSTDLPLRMLAQINTGRQVGKLPSDALRPPILGDFEENCRKYNLKLQSSLKQDITLEIFTRKRHLSISRFFYQMRFLKTNFAERVKGSDLVNRRDRSRIRELWSYRFSASILAALIDVSMSGSTVEEAARGQLLLQFGRSTDFKEATRLMTEGFLMGFLDEEAHMGMKARRVLDEDGNFFSLTDGFTQLKMLYELQELYQVDCVAELKMLIEDCFQKIIQLLPSMANVAKEQETQCIGCCLSLYQMTGNRDFAGYRPVLLETFYRMLEQKDIQPGVEGAVMGLIYGCDSSFDVHIQETASGYLTGTGEMQLKSAAFLRGLFYTARDLVFTRERFLKMVDELLGNLSTTGFMQLLPELRMAFGYFTPLETDRIASQAAGLHGVQKKELLRGRVVSPLEFDYGQQLDAYGRQQMTEVQAWAR